MKINIQSIKGDVVDKVNADEKIFKVELNRSVIRQAVLAEMTNLRQGTHASKNRSAVRGGGKKPFKQKGRGVARAGTILPDINLQFKKLVSSILYALALILLNIVIISI